MEKQREYLKESRKIRNWEDVLATAKKLFSEGRIQGIKFLQIKVEHKVRIHEFFEIENEKSLENLFKIINSSTNIFGIDFEIYRLTQMNLKKF